MRTVVIPLAALLLVLTGCGAAREPTSGAESAEKTFVAIDPSEVTTKIVGGTPEQQEILREVLAGIGASGFTEVGIQKPEPAWGPSSAGSIALVVPHKEGDLHKQWLSWLVAHAFAQRSHELGLPSVSHVAVHRGGVDSETVGPATKPPPPLTLTDAQNAAKKARAAAGRSGAEVERLEILRPYGYAFLVELRIKGEQARFVRDGLPDVLRALGGPQPFDGPYQGNHVLVVDGNGKSVWEGAEAYLGDGAIQIGGVDRWELLGCGPYYRGSRPPFRGEPARRVLPPCPVEPEGEPKDETRSPSDVTTRIVGATPKQETVLREILGGLGENVIEEIRVAPANGVWTPFRPNSVVVYLKSAKTDEKERGNWEAGLIAQAFEARSRSLHLPPVAGYETLNEGIALDGPDEPDPDIRAAVTREEIESGIVSGAKESGAEIVALRIGKPRHLAAAVTLQVGDPASFLKHRLRGFLEAVPSLSTRQYDGLYVLVTDRNGEYVWLSAITEGDSISGGPEGSRRDLAGCYPNPWFGSATGEEPPPCPVD